MCHLAGQADFCCARILLHHCTDCRSCGGSWPRQSGEMGNCASEALPCFFLQGYPEGCLRCGSGNYDQDTNVACKAAHEHSHWMMCTSISICNKDHWWLQVNIRGFDLAGGGANKLDGNITYGAGWTMEAILTFALVFMVYAATDTVRGMNTAHIPVSSICQHCLDSQHCVCSLH